MLQILLDDVKVIYKIAVIYLLRSFNLQKHQFEIFDTVCYRVL